MNAEDADAGADIIPLVWLQPVVTSQSQMRPTAFRAKGQPRGAAERQTLLPVESARNLEMPDNRVKLINGRCVAKSVADVERVTRRLQAMLR